MDINLTNIFAGINEQFAEAERNSVGQKNEITGLFLTHIQLVRVIRGRREILDTIRVEKGIDILEKVKDRGLAFTKYGAVMVVKIYEAIECEYEYNPEYEMPVKRRIQAPQWQRRAVARYKRRLN